MCILFIKCRSSQLEDISISGQFVYRDFVVRGHGSRLVFLIQQCRRSMLLVLYICLCSIVYMCNSVCESTECRNVTCTLNLVKAYLKKKLI